MRFSASARVGALIRQASAVLAPSRDVDLVTLQRTFTLQCHDALTTALAPPLLASIVGQAPGVRLRFLTETAVDTNDLRQGRVDLEIGASAPDLPEVRTETVGHDRLIVALRADHPHLARLDLESYAAQPHVLVSRRGRLSDPVDEMLAAHGLHRRVLAAVGTTATALHIAGHSDAPLTVQEVICRPLIEAFGLTTAPLPAPLPLPQPPIVCNWHQRYDTDPGHTWLRAQTWHVLQTILAVHPDANADQ